MTPSAKKGRVIAKRAIAAGKAARRGTRAKKNGARKQSNVTVSVDNRHGRAGVPTAASFERWIAAALAGRRDTPTQVNIAILGRREARLMNRQYRGRDYATNVLSFPFEPVAAGVPDDLIGDLALCAPVLAREAREQGKAPRDHYAHLVIHGVLHLLGYDHERPRQARAMEAIEIQLLESFGISNPYE